jgi:hypothetical protein
MAGAFDNLDPNETATLIPEILNSTTVMVAGEQLSLAKESNIDIAFSEDIRTLFKVLGFALQVNFSGFGSAPATAGGTRAVQAAA